MGKLKRFFLFLVVPLVLGLVAGATVAFTSTPPAFASHGGPSEKIGVLLGHLPALPLAAVVGGPFYAVDGGETLRGVGNAMVEVVSWAVSRPEHVLLGLVEAVRMIANGEGCHSCPLPADTGPPPSL